jgi:hypothetical protein
MAVAVVLLVGWSQRHRWTVEGRARAEVQRILRDERLLRLTPEAMGELEREASESARKVGPLWASTLTREIIRKDSIWERIYRERLHNRLPGWSKGHLPAATSSSHRFLVATLLLQCCPDIPDLCIQLLRAARDPDAENRCYLLQWVGAESREGALERHLSEFIELASDPDPTVRQTVAMQLGRVAGSSPAARAALERLRADQVSVVREAAEAALLRETVSDR